MTSPLLSAARGNQTRILEAGRFRVIGTALPANLRLPLHAHANDFLTCVRRGHFDEISGSERHSCAPGNVLVKVGGSEHSNVFGPATTVCVHLEVKDHAVRERRLRTGLHRMTPHMASLIACLETELVLADHSSRAIAEGLGLQLLGLMRRAEERGEARRPAWLDKAEEYIRAMRRRPLSISAVAATVDVTSDHLCRAFRKHFGVSVGAYHRGVRLEEAARLLGLDSPSLAQISAELGYADQSHFTRHFRKAYGTTPREYRRRHQSD